MHASTESMCLRRLSDWVYSQSRSQARLRSRVVPVISFMVLSCFIPVFSIYSPIFYYKLRVLPKFLTDNCEFMPETTEVTRTTEVKVFWRNCLLWQLRNIHGNSIGAGRFPGSCTVLPWTFSPIQHQ